MIINIRGTNGSGKSTIVKTFLQRYPYTEIFGSIGARKPEAYKVRLPGHWVYLIGPYQTPIPTGGIDAFAGRSGFSMEMLVETLEKYRKLGNVVFEGAMLSTFHGAVGRWLEEHKDEAVVVFLNTPLDVCLQSIVDRTGPGSKSKLVADKIKSIESVRRRMSELGIRTETLSRDDAFQKIVGWLK
jgi:hypothetical protein